MRRVLAYLICLSISFSFACAEPMSTDSSSYAPILEAWNATTPDDLHNAICQSWASTYVDEADDKLFAPQNWPCKIRLGGTTDELIRDKKRWDLAIVSSKDVDLQALADKAMLATYPHVPGDSLADHQWLLPDALKALLPQDPIWLYQVYVFDYDEQTQDATLLLCRKKGAGSRGIAFALAILSARSAKQSRNTEGIARIIGHWTPGHVVDWTAEELLNHADEWDYAYLTISTAEDLSLLDQANLLFDFSQDATFASRDALHVGLDGYRDSPKGIYSSDGRMIAVPISGRIAEDTQEKVMILNKESPSLEKALIYARHDIRSAEWYYQPAEEIFPYGICLYKKDMDW